MCSGLIFISLHDNRSHLVPSWICKFRSPFHPAYSHTWKVTQIIAKEFLFIATYIITVIQHPLSAAGTVAVHQLCRCSPRVKIYSRNIIKIWNLKLWLCSILNTIKYYTKHNLTLMLTVKDREERYDWIQDRTVLLIPNHDLRRCRRMEWSIVSKAKEI